MKPSILLALVAALAGWTSCASTGPQYPAFQAKEVDQLDLIGEWGTDPALTTTVLVTFEPDGRAQVRHLPGPQGLLEGSFRYSVGADGRGVLGGHPFLAKFTGDELQLAVEGAPGLVFLNRLKPGPTLLPLDDLGSQLVDQGVAGVWIFQGEGRGWASTAATWNDSSLVVDPVAHKIRYYWKGADEGRQTWHSERLGVEGTIVSARPGEIVYKVTYDRSGKGVNQTVTVLYRFQGDQMQWVWAAPGADQFTDYVVYRRTRP